MARAATPLPGPSANLDLLRSVAVSLAFSDHLLETVAVPRHWNVHPYNWQIGRLGVLLFFVHTSFVLLQSLERLEFRGESIWLGFYVRRAFRIYPLAMAVLLAMIVLHIPQMPWSVFRWPGWPAVASNFALTQNLTYSAPLLAPLWSLPPELQMYTVLPVLFVAYGRWPSARLVAIMVAAAVALAVAQPHVSGRLSIAQFAPCFMGGLVAFHESRAAARRLPWAAWVVTLGAAIGVYLFVEALDPSTQHPPLLGWSTCLVLGGIIPLFRELPEGWLARASKTLAKYSYGVYLVHVPVLYVSFVLLRATSVVGQCVTCVVLMTLLPVAAYHGLEQPLIDMGARLARRIQPCHPRDAGPQTLSQPPAPA